MAGVPTRITYADPYAILDTAGQQKEALAGPQWYALAIRARALRRAATLDKLLAPQALYDRLRPHPYQLRVVEQTLREKAPAAILADEVGLGKTVEAGLIYKELALRGVVRSTLILTPKALLAQWQDELAERFDEDFVLTDEKRFRGFEVEDRIICSLPQFVRSFDQIGARPWDMLIVDEAHLLANLQSKRRQRVGELRSRWRLLLTATPVANKLTDLYSLIDLVAPGKLGSLRDFEAEFVADPGTARVLRPQRAPKLRAITREVMCRTRRADTDITFAGRTVNTRTIPATPSEDALIADVTDYLRRMYRRAPTTRLNRGAVIREIMALQQSLTSSPRAIEASLRRRAENHPDEAGALLALANRCVSVESAKESLLLDTLAEIPDEPALIFTLRLDTATRLCDVIRARGRTADRYIGALSRAEREAMVARFNAGELSALVATDAGAEGLNLQQRCHVVFNYDLHWNPMRIEQRIGRVHRLGQTQDVAVFNFVLRDSVDDYVLRLLYQKINLFTMTVGALETVLAEAQDGEIDLEERVLEILLKSESGDDVRRQVESLGDELLLAMNKQREAESFTLEALG
ncbi:MAG TPA: SNF2-related protein [Ktedonobacterales bacterium]